MTTNNFKDITLRILAVDERNGRHIVMTDEVPESAAKELSEVEMRRTTGDKPDIFLFYEPFLGMLDAIEGDAVPFRLDVVNWKLYFAPRPEHYFGDASIAVSPNPSAFHRLYKMAKRKHGEKLYWCVGLDNKDAKKKAEKAKLVLLDVGRLCGSPMPVDKAPARDSLPGSELYITLSPSKLAVALPHRAGALYDGLPSSRVGSNNTLFSSRSSLSVLSSSSSTSSIQTTKSDPSSQNTTESPENSPRSPVKAHSSHQLGTRLKRNVDNYEGGAMLALRS